MLKKARRGSWLNLLSQGRLDDTKKQRTRTLAAARAISKAAFLIQAPNDRNPKGASLSRRLIIHPESPFVFYWNIMLMGMIVYESFAVPFFIFFGVAISSDLGVLEFIITITFLLDIGRVQTGLNFNTAYFEQGNFVSSRWAITKSYIRLWFWLDMLSSLPFPWLMGAIITEPSERTEDTFHWTNVSNVLLLMRVIRFLRVLRLLRLAKLKRIFVRIEDYIASTTLASIFQFLRLLFVVFLIAHWIACLWYYVGVVEALNEHETWVTVMLAHGPTTMELYTTAFYFTMSTMSTVGYGDIHPYTRVEMIFVILIMVVACGIFAYTIGSISSLINKSNAEGNEYRNRVISVNRYMKKKDVPYDTQFRVRRYLEYLWENQKKNILKEKEIISMLSASLRDEISAFVHGAILLSCPVFEQMETQLISRLSKSLDGETFAPGDVIIVQGQITNKLYFLQTGEVSVFHRETNTHFATLGRNMLFGEIAFFSLKPRTASVCCMSFVDVFALTRTDLDSMAEELPVSKERLEIVQNKCSSGDFSSLQVRCYICLSLGHVATRCSKVLINFDHEFSQKKWLNNRLQQSKFINPYMEPAPNLDRYRRPKLKIHYTARNTTAGHRSPREIYRNEPQIQQLIKDFEEDVEEEQDFTGRQMSIQSKQSVEDVRMTRKPRISIIYKSETMEMTIPEMQRKAAFRKSLLMRAPIVEIENYYTGEGQKAEDDVFFEGKNAGLSRVASVERTPKYDGKSKASEVTVTDISLYSADRSLIVSSPDHS